MLKKRSSGFTMVEIMVVVAIIGIIAVIGGIKVRDYRLRAYYTRAVTEMRAMDNAFSLYRSKYNDFPPDVGRNVPAGIKEFVDDTVGEDWPFSPFPGGVYDYENWPDGPWVGITEPAYQITIRFCEYDQDQLCQDLAKKYLSEYVDEDTLNSWDSYSAMYFCFEGSVCRSHRDRPLDHPGYCVNCGDRSIVF